LKPGSRAKCRKRRRRAIPAWEAAGIACILRSVVAVISQSSWVGDALRLLRTVLNGITIQCERHKESQIKTLRSPSDPLNHTRGGGREWLHVTLCSVITSALGGPLSLSSSGGAREAGEETFVLSPDSGASDTLPRDSNQMDLCARVFFFQPGRVVGS